MIAAVLGVILLGIVCLYMFFGKHAPLKGNLLPGPDGLPFLGSYFDIQDDNLHLKLYEYAEKFGKILRFKVILDNVVVLNDLDLMKKAFTDEPHRKYFNDRLDLFYGQQFRRGNQAVGFIVDGCSSFHDAAVRQFNEAMEKFGCGHMSKEFEKKIMSEMEKLVQRIETSPDMKFDCVDVFDKSMSNIIAIVELESIISDHFGRTPLSTPLCSQNSELIEDLTDLYDEDHNEETLNVENVIDGRARGYLHRADDDTSSSEDEVSENLATLRNTDNDFQRVQSFNRRGCECTKKCSAKFTVEEIYDHILNVREMTKDEKELYIMGVVGEVTNNEKTKRGKKRQRMRHVFRFHGHVVCKGTFLLCYDIGRTSLQNIIKHIEEQGLTPRRHGNKGKTKPHSLKYEDVQRVVRFICNHADEKGLPQPAAPRGTDNIPPIYLSAETTKKSLHDEYMTASAQVTPPVRTVKLSAFKTIWLTCLPHIKIAAPKDDVCATCEKIRKMIIDAVDEGSKLTASTDMSNHVLQAQKERELYNDCIRRSRESHLRQVDGYTHYTFDFSQNINLPHFSRQMGPLYFLSLLKVQLFGFRIDGEPRQLNFLIGEDETMGIDGSETHGPNAVISMVDWVLQTYGDGVTTCAIHADNCPGQNKNKFVLGYFMWRTMTGQHEKIEYHMQVPGHAKCLIDGGFGLVKKLYRRSDCETMDQLETIVNKSSVTNQAVRYQQWNWRNWKTFLSQYFKPLTGIRQYQYFKFMSEEPGIVTVRGLGEDEKKICILKNPTFRFQTSERPIPIRPQGFSHARKSYLYKTVRPFVRPANQNDFCPAPENNI